MEIILRDRMPCWYNLSWQEGEPAILLIIHRDFLDTFRPIEPTAPVVPAMMQEFGFSQFDGDFNTHFGFDRCLRREGSDESAEFLEFAAPLPVVRKDTGRPCEECGGGSGKDELRNGECLYCEGCGTQHEFHWRSAFAVSASLGLFFRLSYFPEKRTSATAPQLLTVHLHTAQGPHGGELSGMYSIPLAEWLRAQSSNRTIPEMVRAMKVAYGHMFGASRVNGYLEYSFKASIDSRNGGLHIDCPGDACGLHPIRSPEPGRGYEFSSHNVDTPAQQLTLLTGLAALCDQVRKEYA